MKRLFSFLIITFLVFMVLEIFNAKDLSIKSQDLTYNFTTDALASLNEKEGEPQPAVNYYSSFDSTTILLLGTGLVGLAGLGIRKIE